MSSSPAYERKVQWSTSQSGCGNAAGSRVDAARSSHPALRGAQKPLPPSCGPFDLFQVRLEARLLLAQKVGWRRSLQFRSRRACPCKNPPEALFHVGEHYSAVRCFVRRAVQIGLLHRSVIPVEGMLDQVDISKPRDDLGQQRIDRKASPERLQICFVHHVRCTLHQLSQSDGSTTDGGRQAGTRRPACCAFRPPSRRVSQSLLPVCFDTRAYLRRGDNRSPALFSVSSACGPP